MVEQLTLAGLQLRDDATFANFFMGDNIPCVLALQQMTMGQGEQYLYLWGAVSSGRSHLLQACCHQAGLVGRSAVYLNMQQHREWSPALLEGLESIGLICLDDIEAIAKLPDWETELFYLYNRAKEAQAKLIVAGNCGPSQLPLALPDLRSRLAWGLVYQLHELSDADKIAAVQMRAKNRGFNLPDEVAQFLLKRCARDMQRLCEILDRLDAASLVAQRRITIPFVKESLGL